MITPFLDHLALLQGAFELLIVDGESSDATRARILQYASPFPAPLHLLSAPAGRSGQMNTGAAAARGDMLLFLHVDCRIPADSLQDILRVTREQGVCGGAFIHSFGERGLFHAVIGLLVNTCTKYTRTFFGDFGIFVKRDVFSRAGGFELIPFCEDLEFCRSVRTYGRMKQINRVRAGIRPLFLKRYIADR
jgi:glycosyltransferase involved in cell wall biosynthesis